MHDHETTTPTPPDWTDRTGDVDRLAGIDPVALDEIANGLRIAHRGPGRALVTELDRHTATVRPDGVIHTWTFTAAMWSDLIDLLDATAVRDGKRLHGWAEVVLPGTTVTARIVLGASVTDTTGWRVTHGPPHTHMCGCPVVEGDA